MALNTGNDYLDSIGGTKWVGAQYYSLADGALILTYYFDDGGAGGAWEANEREAFERATSTWRDVANVRFIQVDQIAAADYVVQKVTSAELPDKDGDADYPDSSEHLIRFNVDSHWNAEALKPGGAMYEVMVHEIGHTLGLAHPFDNDMGTKVFPGITPGESTDTGTRGLNAIPYTVMAYNPATGTNANVQDDRGFAATPLALDIATLQRMYGSVNHNVGNDTYLLSDDVAGSAYRTIWDTGGNDTIQYNGSHNAHIDLRYATIANSGNGIAGRLSSVEGVHGGYTIAGPNLNLQPVVIENAVGGSGGDELIGNEFANRLEGRGGSDTLDGGVGNDTMTGGADPDTFHFANDWGEDVITDFDAGVDGDFISVLDVDAIKSTFDLRPEMSADGENLKLILISDPDNAINLNHVTLDQLNARNFLIRQRAEDGYLSGATVFADANGNSEFDPGEASSVTDANGIFSLRNQAGTLIAFGGVDTSTGLPMNVRVMAPDRSIVITPLTTLLVAGATESKVVAALGLSLGLGLTFDDPIAALLGGNLNAAKVYVEGAKVIDTVFAIATAITGLGGDTSEAQHDAFAAIADAINALPAGSHFDLSDPATIAALLDAVADKQGIDVSEIAPVISSQIADSNATIDQHLETDGASAGLLEHVSDVQRDVQSNQPPVAVYDPASAVKGGTATGNVLSNDSDPDGDSLQVIHVTGGELGQPVEGKAGVLTLNEDGHYEYVSTEGGLIRQLVDLFDSPVTDLVFGLVSKLLGQPSHYVAEDSFRYSITDGNGGAASASLSVFSLLPGQHYQSGTNTTLTGSDAMDVLDGFGGHDILVGGGRADVLIAGPDNTMTGGAGPDTFLFRPDFGANTITDFETGYFGDLLQIDRSIYDDFDDVMAHSSDTLAGVLIDDGAGNTITLANVKVAQLQASDLHFV